MPRQTRRAPSSANAPRSRSPVERRRGTPAFVYVPDLMRAGVELELSDAESRYVATVCRVRGGETVVGADGRGLRAVLTILATGRRVRARVESIEAVTRACRAWMVTGAPEGNRDDWLVEKLAELGVERWIPLDCERGGWTCEARRRERWERLSTAAMKQSCAAHRMEIAPAATLASALETLPPAGARWLASVDGADGCIDSAPGSSWVGAVGPAAGFTGREARAFEAAGFHAVRLGAARLRTETAALALAAVLMTAHRGDGAG